MTGKKCFWCKIVTLSIAASAFAFLAFASLNVDYQFLLAQEHRRFRKDFPSQVNWITSPIGTMRCYLFNVTNPEEFLNGTDSKIKLQEVGPITYHLTGKNDILKQTDTSLLYEKIRYEKIEFDPEMSAPNILNQTIILPNFLLLGSAAKFHDWFSLIRPVFNAVTINEPPFIKRSVYYFLWDFTTPTLNLLSTYVPNIQSNCGFLYNALMQKDELYDVKIALNYDSSEFFSVNTMNNKTVFPEQASRLQSRKNSKDDEYCPIHITGALDNSLFPPFLNKDSSLNIIAPEACRTHRLLYNKTVEELGFKGYKYLFDMSPSCLDISMGIKLHSGMFDVSSCLINDVPSAFSFPHFYGSSYDWREHFEGLSPNAKEHEGSIVIEPITGIPVEEKYRFQSNIPMPDSREMAGYSNQLIRFSNMVIPTFWFEYDLDDLPSMVQYLMYFNVYIVPIAQPLLIGLFIIITFYCVIKIYILSKGTKVKNLIQYYIGTESKPLESTFKVPVNDEELSSVQTKY